MNTMQYTIHKPGLLILAAGQSKRLGSSKQLLHYEGQGLLNRLIGIVKTSMAAPLTLVLGAAAETIHDQLTDKELDIVIHPAWQEGMASSLRAGLQHLIGTHPETDGVLVLVCDQPFVTTEHIRALFTLQEQTRKPVAASCYAGVSGTPALFHSSVFPGLLALAGDTGARKLIKAMENDVALLNFEKGLVDIDTIEDYHNLISGNRKNDH